MRRPKPRIANHLGVRCGVFYFLLILCILEGFRWVIKRTENKGLKQHLVQLDSSRQALLDQIRAANEKSLGWTLRPLDPNKIDDYKGYLLGIPFPALDSLYTYRSRGGTLTNLDDFQQATGLPDTSCSRLEPFLQFSRPPRPAYGKKMAVRPSSSDLNEVDAAELQVVYGVGPVLSERIVRFRKALGGFLNSEQLLDVYGLSPQVAERVTATFPILSKPKIAKVEINTASVSELSSLVYISKEMAQSLVAFRDSLGPFTGIHDLRKVKSLPEDKIDRIALYLKF